MKMPRIGFFGELQIMYNRRKLDKVFVLVPYVGTLFTVGAVRSCNVIGFFTQINSPESKVCQHCGVDRIGLSWSSPASRMSFAAWSRARKWMPIIYFWTLLWLWSLASGRYRNSGFVNITLRINNITLAHEFCRLVMPVCPFLIATSKFDRTQPDRPCDSKTKACDPNYHRDVQQSKVIDWRKGKCR